MDFEYRDASGVVRRPGSLLATKLVSSFPPYEGAPERPMWTDDEIRKVISDPNRRDMVKLFPFEKYGTNQHSTSACNGWGWAGAQTRARKLRGIDDGWVGSGSWIYSKINGGRDQGSVIAEAEPVVENIGTASQTIVTYSMIYPQQQPKEAAVDAANHKVLGAYRAMTMQGFRSGLAAGYIGIAAVMCGPKWDRITDGVAGVQSGPGNHAVCIEDIRLIGGVEHFLLPNSWGIGYGNKGRVWVTAQHFKQTFPNHIFYLVPSTLEKVT